MSHHPDARRPGLARSLSCFLALTLALVGLFGLLALRVMPAIGP
jgi:hypothetical protein